MKYTYKNDSFSAVFPYSFLLTQQKIQTSLFCPSLLWELRLLFCALDTSQTFFFFFPPRSCCSLLKNIMYAFTCTKAVSLNGSQLLTNFNYSVCFYVLVIDLPCCQYLGREEILPRVYFFQIYFQRT